MNDLWKINSKTFWRCTINRLLHWKAYSNVSQLTMSDSSRKQTFWFSRICTPSVQSWVNSRNWKFSSSFAIKFYYIFNLATSWLSEFFPSLSWLNHAQHLCLLVIWFQLNSISVAGCVGIPIETICDNEKREFDLERVKKFHV